MSIHFPVEFTVGTITVSAHAVFEMLAFLIGYRYYVYLKKGYADAISSENRLFIIVGAAIGALLGSRLLGALEEPHHWLESSNPWMYLYVSKTIVGGLLGGLWGVETIKYFIKEPASSGDLFTFPLLLAMMIGRVGCFLNGVYEPTYGIVTDVWCGMDLGDGLMRHPLALYELVFLACLWMGLYLLQKRVALQNGTVFKYFMIAYLLFRFSVDFIKPGFRYSFGLTSIQLACIVGLLYYAVVIGRSMLLSKAKTSR